MTEQDGLDPNPDRGLKEYWAQQEARGAQGPGRLRSAYQESPFHTRLFNAERERVPERIPGVMRRSLHEILAVQLEILGEDRWFEGQFGNPYDLKRLLDNLAYQARIWQAQLSPELVNELGLDQISPRAMIPELLPDGRPRPGIWVERADPVYDPMTLEPIPDKYKRVTVYHEFKKPVSDAQLEGAVIGADYAQTFLKAWLTMMDDFLAQMRMGGDAGRATEGAMQAEWRDTTPMGLLAVLFRRENIALTDELARALTPAVKAAIRAGRTSDERIRTEAERALRLITAKEEEKREAGMVQRAYEGWEIVGKVYNKNGLQGAGVVNIFNEPPTGDHRKHALEWVTARVLGRPLPPARLDQLRDPGVKAAKSIALEGLALYRFLWGDTEAAGARKQKGDGSWDVVKKGDLYNLWLGLPPGAPKTSVDAGKVTASDASRLVHFPGYAAAQVTKKHPYYMGPVSPLICAFPRLTLQNLDLFAAYRQSRTGKEQRLSFTRLREMGVELAELPWDVSSWEGGHRYFDHAFGTPESEKAEWRAVGEPVGPRVDGDDVPALYHHMRAYKDFYDPLTTKDVAKFWQWAIDPAQMNAENKGINLWALMMMGHLKVTDPSMAERLGQFLKVHKRAAAWLSKHGTLDKSNEYPGKRTGWGARGVIGLNTPLDPEVQTLQGAGNESVIRTLAEEFVDKGRRRLYWTQQRGMVIWPTGDAHKLEEELFYRIINQRRGVSPKDSGWWSDKELWQLAPLYSDLGIGYQQSELLGFLNETDPGKPQITDPRLLQDLGFTTKLSDEQLDSLSRRTRTVTDQRGGQRQERVFSEEALRHLVWLGHPFDPRLPEGWMPPV
ncbi:MAG: hypothetical protein JW991_03585 [Candidatus Pacebacteria bacterium]|nr:hypothetical protein [Candidatus Paceibacterota bacterium]